MILYYLTKKNKNYKAPFLKTLFKNHTSNPNAFIHKIIQVKKINSFYRYLDFLCKS
jgi:hypothetical protein